MHTEKNNLHDVVIRNGKIIDGSGSKPFIGDVAIDDGKISLIGTIEGSGKKEIDAKGNLVTPGWVDVHTHYDGNFDLSTKTLGIIGVGNVGSRLDFKAKQLGITTLLNDPIREANEGKNKFVDLDVALVLIL